MSSPSNGQGHDSSHVPPSSQQNNTSASNKPSTNTILTDPLSEREQRVYNAFKDDCTAKLQGPPPPIPLSEDRSHWERSFECMQKHDTAMCEGFNAALDNLLILIGLFSGVVSAFTIESYRWLQPDSEDLTMRILLQVSAQLANPTLAPIATIPDSFSPSSSVRSINVLWFLSLTIALLDALLAILCKQWLQEYKEDVSSLPSQAAMALRQLRFEAFQYWKVEKIISSLPVILQLSLLLFLAGLLNLLWTLEHSLAAIITSIVGVGITFVFATTFLPVIVARINEGRFEKALPNMKDNTKTTVTETEKRPPFNPIPLCAYKSPQSWLWVKLSFLPMMPDRTTKFKLAWMHLEGRWLRLQNMYDQDFPQYPKYRHPVSRALYWVDQNCGGSKQVLIDLFHCFSDYTATNVVADIFQKLDPFRQGIHNFEKEPVPGEWIPLGFMSYNEDIIARIPKARFVIGERLIRYIHTTWIRPSGHGRPELDTKVCIDKTFFRPLIDFFDCDKHPLNSTNRSIGPASASSKDIFHFPVWSPALAPALKFIFECHAAKIDDFSDFMMLEQQVAKLFENMTACLERICREDPGKKSFHLRFWMEAIIESFEFVRPVATQKPPEVIPASSRELPWWRRHTIRRLLGLEHASRETGGMEQAEGSKTSADQLETESHAFVVKTLREKLAKPFAPVVDEKSDADKTAIEGHKRRMHEFNKTVEQLVCLGERRWTRMLLPLMQRMNELSEETPDVSIPEGWGLVLKGCQEIFEPQPGPIPDVNVQTHSAPEDPVSWYLRLWKWLWKEFN